MLPGKMILVLIAEATPKTIMRAMGVKGLTLFHLKSHLQVHLLIKFSNYYLGLFFLHKFRISLASDLT